ncbi:glycosyltransferase [Planktotalea sp.]|uniref:glycosyltransferase n=1 Tax=Planktotalea sp. TaxID=2029877 RepID=UPI003D6BD15C
MKSSIHFVVPASFARELSELPDQALGQNFPYWFAGRYNWVAQSWMVLRQYREGLTIGTTPKAGVMNFSHVMGWRENNTRNGEFRISVRADYRRMFDVDFEILQNSTVKTGSRQAYLPYWPVPGLIARNPDRIGLKTLAYAGLIGPLNLANELRAADDRLNAYDFRVIEPHLWHDLSEIDALVAIRSFDTKTHDAKPPSKLFSAWLAGVPLIAGYDSAFSSVGRPGVDYIRVKSEAEFHEALARLASDPKYYASFVDAGKARAAEVSHDAIAKIWLECIDTQITPAFEKWQAEGDAPLRGYLARTADGMRTTASRAKRALRAVKGRS